MIRHIKKVVALCFGVLMLFMAPLSSFAELRSGLSIVFPIVAPKLSSKYGSRKHPVKKYVTHHSGVDLAAPQNSHVRAVAAGVVIFSDTYGGYGKLVTIQHDNGYISLYGHLNEYLVNVGQKVTAGQLIGRVGSTGISTGPHLHFEWRKDGTAINPLTVFPALAEKSEG